MVDDVEVEVAVIADARGGRPRTGLQLRAREVQRRQRHDVADEVDDHVDRATLVEDAEPAVAELGHERVRLDQAGIGVVRRGERLRLTHRPDREVARQRRVLVDGDVDQYTGRRGRDDEPVTGETDVETCPGPSLAGVARPTGPAGAGRVSRMRIGVTAMKAAGGVAEPSVAVASIRWLAVAFGGEDAAVELAVNAVPVRPAMAAITIAARPLPILGRVPRVMIRMSLPFAVSHRAPP